MQVLLLGGTGQVGQEVRALAPASTIHIVAPGRAQLDLSLETHVTDWIARERWSAVINAAAFTDVDAAEGNERAAFALNATGASRLAVETSRHGIPLIHISTDYVFDGRKGSPYTPADTVNPVNVYGVSKVAGEAGVRMANARHVIIRTSWLYSTVRNNFVKTMLRLGAQRDRLTVVDDQYGCPTAASDVAAASLIIAKQIAKDPDRAPYGTYHYAGRGETTWYRFACAIFELSRASTRTPQLVPVSTAEYPTAARRPIDTRLDCSSTVGQWGISPRDWRTALNETLARLLGAPEDE